MTNKLTTNVPHDDSPWHGKIWFLGLPNDQERWPLDQVPPNIGDRHKPYIAFINIVAREVPFKLYDQPLEYTCTQVHSQNK